MKIALVISQPPAYSETFLRTKILGLQKEGFEVVLYCDTNPPHKNFDLCPVKTKALITKNVILQLVYFMVVFIALIPFYSQVKRFAKLQKKDGITGVQLIKSIYLNAYLLKSNADWIHFGFATFAIDREAVAKAIGAKMGVSFRGFDMGTYPVKNPGCYDRLWKYVDKIHTNSNDLWNNAKRFGMPETIPVVKITPAINIDLFTSDIQKTDSATPVFITTGRLHWKKGYIQILEALALLKKEGIPFQYKIIGAGEDYERLAFAAYDMGIKDEVEFVGRIPHKEVKKHLAEADVYIQYSIQEGFCNAVLEAQAMGKLCVVSDAEGLSENIKHNHSGWVVPKYAPEKLAERLKYVLSLSPEEKLQFSKNAINRVRSEFTIPIQQEKFADFFKDEKTK